MKRLLSWKTGLVIILLAASAGFYFFHFLIFHDSHHIFLYMIGDLAFLFIDILVVILFIENLLERRERKSRIKKLNMVIGTFFSEVGLELLRAMTSFVQNADALKEGTAVETGWGRKDFDRARQAARDFPYQVQAEPAQLARLRPFLLSKYPFLLTLLENPNLLEHESFTDLLWAVFHLLEELAVREDVGHLHDADIRHIIGDINRAYELLLVEWLAYLAHLKSDYPYLFSLALRMNPFDPNASPGIR